MDKNIAYCGLDCNRCDAYLATVGDDQALREATAKKWSEWNKIEIKPEWIRCEGCRGEGVKTYFCEVQCGIRRCAVGKGMTTCGQCAEMETCPTLAMILANSEEAASNLRGEE